MTYSVTFGRGAATEVKSFKTEKAARKAVKDRLVPLKERATRFANDTVPDIADGMDGINNARFGEQVAVLIDRHTDTHFYYSIHEN